ncbi:acyltransferase [bacterium]|nr:acyltransferase [bacterium]
MAMYDEQQMSKYDPEIDGLRAIAVLSVMFYHFDVAFMSGGFIGVDVFFVISGFLITRLIAREIEETGRFIFSRFYLRRLKRLFPALLSTTIFSLIASVLLFSPENLTSYAESLFAALFSVSNFYFWYEADYFDALANTKPLLHTWSLSVEEQFYLIWPAALVILISRFSRAVLYAALGFLIVASIGLGDFWAHEDRTGAFYLLPTRIAELGIGAALVWLEKAGPWSRKLNEPAMLLGLALIAVAAFEFTQRTRIPGHNALLPCLGAALVIRARHASYAAFVLRAPPIVQVGRISYSLYLVHWPLMVFYQTYWHGEIGPFDQIGLVVSSLLLAWLQYRFVEQKFRHQSFDGWSARAAVSLYLVPVVVVTGFAGSMVGTEGWKWRIAEERLLPSSRENRKLVFRDYCASLDPSKPEEIFTCQNYRGSQHDIIIWGDSHARHLTPGISEAFPNHNIYDLYLSGCVPQSGFKGYVRQHSSAKKNQPCVDHNKRALEYLRNYKESTIILSSAKRSKPEIIAESTRWLLAELRAAGHSAIILGDFIRPGRQLSDCFSVPDFLPQIAKPEDHCTGNKKIMKHGLAYNDALEELLPGFISPNMIQCPDGVCQFFKEGLPLYADHHHLNPRGSIHFISKLKHALPISNDGADED